MALLSLSVGVPANFACFYIIGLLSGQEKYTYRRFVVASVVGLGLGSIIVGFGVWGWSQFFVLPGAEYVKPMVISGAFLTALWTFVSEIPFLILVVPLIVKAYRGF